MRGEKVIVGNMGLLLYHYHVEVLMLRVRPKREYIHVRGVRLEN